MQNGEICLSFSALFWIRRCGLVDGEWPGTKPDFRWRNDGGFIPTGSMYGIFTYLGGGFKYFFYFQPYLGKIPILTNIFQMG